MYVWVTTREHCRLRIHELAMLSNHNRRLYSSSQSCNHFFHKSPSNLVSRNILTWTWNGEKKTCLPDKIPVLLELFPVELKKTKFWGSTNYHNAMMNMNMTMTMMTMTMMMI